MGVRAEVGDEPGMNLLKTRRVPLLRTRKMDWHTPHGGLCQVT